MSKVQDFRTKYAEKIISICPSFIKEGALGWAIINRNAEQFGGTENVPIIHRSGLIKPFSTDLNLITQDELCEKLVSIWRNDAGFSKEPIMLVVEKPEPAGADMKFSTVTDLSIFVGMLINALSPQLTLIPALHEWKGSKDRPDSRAKIESISDYHSKRALKRDLELVATHNRHNLFEALALGIYGAEVDLKRKPTPRLFLKAA